MNDRPTPETDAFFRTFADGEAAPSHAEYFDRMRRLERERDEAREKLATERALADKLARALDRMLHLHDNGTWHGKRPDERAREVIKKWKEARSE